MMCVEDKDVVKQILKLKGWVEIDTHWFHLSKEVEYTFEQAKREEGIR